MKCAKCGQDLPQGAKFCSSCGGNEFVETQEAPRKVKPIVLVAVGLAAVIIIALVVAVIAGGRKNVASAPPPAPGPAANVATAPPPAPAGGNVVTAPPANPAPAVTPPGATKPKPPQEVVDYLAFVKKVEEHRQMLLKDTGDALTLMVAGQALSLEKMFDWLDEGKGGEIADPLADVKTETGRQYKNWLSTVRYFDGKAAPQECRAFSGAYRDLLVRQTTTIGQIVVTLNKIDLTKTQDMRSAATAMMAMKKDSSLQGGIDTAADNADAKLTQLVSQYDMEKPFKVPREESGGSIVGF